METYANMKFSVASYLRIIEVVNIHTVVYFNFLFRCFTGQTELSVSVNAAGSWPSDAMNQIIIRVFAHLINAAHQRNISQTLLRPVKQL